MPLMNCSGRSRNRKFALLRRTRQGKQGRQPISRAWRQSRNDGNLTGIDVVDADVPVVTELTRRVFVVKLGLNRPQGPPDARRSAGNTGMTPQCLKWTLCSQRDARAVLTKVSTCQLFVPVPPPALTAVPVHAPEAHRMAATCRVPPGKSGWRWVAVQRPGNQEISSRPAEASALQLRRPQFPPASGGCGRNGPRSPRRALEGLPTPGWLSSASSGHFSACAKPGPF